MRYGIAIVVIIFLTIVGIVVLANHTGSNSTKNKNQTSRVTTVSDYDDKDGAEVSWTQAGRLVGEDTYREIRVTVTRNNRHVEIIGGYNGQVIKSQDFASTPAAFENFTRAIDRAGFGKERNVANPDERGVCPLGNRFIYRMTNNGAEVMRTWSDTCSPNDGPFAGIASTNAQLFRSQITNYSQFTAGTIL